MTAELLWRLDESVKLFTLWEAHRETLSASLSESRLENKGLQLIYRGLIYISLNQYLKIYPVFVSLVSVFFFSNMSKRMHFQLIFLLFKNEKQQGHFWVPRDPFLFYHCLAIKQFKGILLNFLRKFSSSINRSMSIFKYNYRCFGM